MLEAEQVELQRSVALKLLLVRPDSDPTAGRRFVEEARATAALSHPNIVRLLDFDIEEGMPWIAYELMPGGTLADLVRDSDQTWDVACRQVRHVLLALEEAHAHGILHRDIKAQNVLVAEDGTLKLSDFGLAKLARPESEALTRTGDVMGSPAYIAPELLLGGTNSVQSDVYSAGVLLFEALTGHWPYRSTSLPALLALHVRAAVPHARAERPAIPESVDAAVARAMAKSPQDRWPTVRAFRDALDAALATAGLPLAGSVARPAAPQDLCESPTLRDPPPVRPVRSRPVPRAAPPPVARRPPLFPVAAAAALAVAVATWPRATPPPAPAATVRPTVAPGGLTEPLLQRARDTVTRAMKLREGHTVMPSLFRQGMDVDVIAVQGSRADQLRPMLVKFRAVHQSVHELVAPAVEALADALPDRAAAPIGDVVLLAQLRAIDAVSTLSVGSSSGVIDRIDRRTVKGSLVAMAADPDICYPVECAQRVHAFFDDCVHILGRAAAPVDVLRVAEMLIEVRWVADRFRFIPFCGSTLEATRERGCQRLRTAPRTPESERVFALALDVWTASTVAGTPAARRRVPAIFGGLDALGPASAEAAPVLERLKARLRENLGSAPEQAK